MEHRPGEWVSIGDLPDQCHEGVRFPAARRRRVNTTALLVAAFAVAGCMPVEAVGRAALIAGHAGRVERPTSDVEVVRCKVAGGADVFTAPRNCVDGAAP